MSTAPPPQTDIDSYKVASEEFARQLVRLRELIQVDLKELENRMRSAGAPWTPGTLPEWNN
jgi:hypothetical protein